MNRVTAKMLTLACGHQSTEFERRFPRGVTFRSEADAVKKCAAVADAFDWSWAARLLLPAPARAEYFKARAHARGVYLKARAAAWAEYKKATAPAQAKYVKAMALAWAVAFWNAE